MQNCLFCKIVRGEIPADKVYEDERVMAFLDINPQAPVHLLVIPRRHLVCLADATAEDAALLGHIQCVIAELAHTHGFADAGFRVVNNCNEDGGQEVEHIHYHVLAGRRMQWPPG
ncbi:MAG: histidine triad nucleotide-binding protein [Desulfuromonadaceae bacterium]|nr:histidine triad nucleotide-binding protein [Desulfuromonas sp.]MDY0185223.1 histidine triad nucleotide-binding protein [Desulfuromonadaceae bacterium]